MKLGLQVVRFDWPGSPVNTGAKLAEIADINNISSGRNAGTIIGATFLKNFVKHRSILKPPTIFF